MRWIGDRESENIEDRRGVGRALPVGIGGIGAIVVVLVGLFLGVDPSTLLALLSGGRDPATGRHPSARRQRRQCIARA